MDTPLTEEQRELLSAYADGEVTEAERQHVQQLLQRESAREYLNSLQATISLVKTHAQVPAPVGLSGRVLGALEGEFKPKDQLRGAQTQAGAPVISWRTPLYAAAAAVVVSLGIMFGPSLAGPGEGSQSSVARSVLDNLPAPTAEVDTGRDPLARDFAGRTSADSLAPADELAEDMRMNRAIAERETPESARKPEAAKSDATSRASGGNAPRSNAGEPAAEGAPRGNDASDDPKERSEAEADGKPVQESATDTNQPGRNAEDDPNAGGAAVPPLGGGAGEAADSDTERRAQGAVEGKEAEDKGKSDAAPLRDDGEAQPLPVKRARLGAPAQEPLPEGGDATLVEISDARSLTAQTDVLWVSSLYGDASLSEDDDSDIESVTVAIEAEKLPALLAALRKLAADQGYGKVTGAGQDAEKAELKAEENPRIDGYLPVSDTDEEAPGKTGLSAPAKVRLVIRLQ